MNNVVEFRFGLDQRAGRINKFFDDAAKAKGRLDASRLNAGRELIEAQFVAENELGPGQWESWCKANINRSQGDIRKVMKLASEDDPELALKLERAAAREGMAKHRANVSAVDETNDVKDLAPEPSHFDAPAKLRRSRASPYSRDPVSRMIHMYRMLDVDDKTRFMKLLERERNYDEAQK